MAFLFSLLALFNTLTLSNRPQCFARHIAIFGRAEGLTQLWILHLQRGAASAMLAPATGTSASTPQLAVPDLVIERVTFDEPM